MNQKSTRPIAIWYHAYVPKEPSHAFDLIWEQWAAVEACGLMDKADDIFIGVNGTLDDVERIVKMLPRRAIVFQNPPDLWPAGEVPTMRAMAEWASANRDANILYFHTKGASFPKENGAYEHRRDWRLRMEDVVLRRWRECVAYLEDGHESVGQWWNVAFNGQYWAGNFFWVTAEFLCTLPYLSVVDQNQGGRYEAEVWIGRGPRLPSIVSL